MLYSLSRVSYTSATLPETSVSFSSGPKSDWKRDWAGQRGEASPLDVALQRDLQRPSDPAGHIEAVPRSGPGGPGRERGWHR